MKKLLQSLNSGEIYHSQIPVPSNSNGEYLIRTTRSLISTGTEKMLLEFGKSNLVEKALQQPEKVKQTLNKIKTDGIAATFEAVTSKLNEPLEMGYCNVGIIEETFPGGLPKGTRVASNGSHASFVVVPENLVVKIPDNVSDDQAAFTVPGSISLQGIRLAKPELGEVFVVIGLGLIGLLTVQILVANGCKVYGIDIDENKCKTAELFGAKCFTTSSNFHSNIKNENLHGVDGVIITASSKSNKIIEDAAYLCRKRGRIILIGVIGLQIDRAMFYDKELSFQVSCSYGPGRYDTNYEEKGLDYPIEYVRWTENRNFHAVLNLMASKKIDPAAIHTEKFKFDDAQEAYKQLTEKLPYAIMLEYQDIEIKKTITLQSNKNNFPKENPSVSFIGSGNYASRVLMPAFKEAGFEFKTLQSKNGLSAKNNGEKFGFKQITTDEDVLYSDDSDLVVIATRHNLHASQICKSFENKKNVFVEKPLALKLHEIEDIKNAYLKSDRKLIVGFNRMFSPFIDQLKQELSLSLAPKSITMTMNAGKIDRNHWTQDKDVGGGRIIGEACHYIDLLMYLCGSDIDSFNAMHLGNASNEVRDSASISIKFKNGSIGTINYFANGAQSFPKEKIEVFCDGKVIVVDNFKSIEGYGSDTLKNKKTLTIKKGQKEMIKAVYECLKNGSDFPIPFEEILKSAEVSIEVDRLL